MANTLFHWLFTLIECFMSFGTWLTQPLINGFSPLAIFSLAGLSFILGYLVINFLRII